MCVLTTYTLLYRFIFTLITIMPVPIMNRFNVCLNKKSSHMWAHFREAHSDVGHIDLRGVFRFEVVKSFRTAFMRQMAEVLTMKNSKGYILNLKDEYNR